jgi:acetyl-CoA C-acetyltransferase
MARRDLCPAASDRHIIMRPMKRVALEHSDMNGKTIDSPDIGRPDIGRTDPVTILGWGHTRFGKLMDQTLESLMGAAAKEALAHAGIEAHEIDEVVVSHFNQGMDPQGFPASLPIQSLPGLRYKPATRVENACASGSAAVRQGIRSIAAGEARLVLVVGAEKMTSNSGPEIQKALASASYVAEEAGPDASFAGIFAQIAQLYFQRYGDKSDALARIAAKNHGYGALNPLAHLQKDLGYEFCRKVTTENPLVAPPLRRTDCSMVSDGAAALVLAAPDLAAGRAREIRIRSSAHVNDALPMSGRDMTYLEGAARAWKLALARAGLALDDLDFAESHDCFTIAELMQYEAMGLATPGRGADLREEGATALGGRLPVNLSGGLKAKGHPIGATGVSMHVIAARQLAGEPLGARCGNARLGGIFNMGGAGVANYCSILERTR